MSIYKSGTLLITSGPAHDPDRKHLHVVCTDQDDEKEVLIVGICSYVSERNDGTCILEHFHHEFLKHKSYVLYSECQYAKVPVLEHHIANNNIVAMEDMNGQAFLKVKNGICKSPHTPRKIKARYGCAVASETASDNDNVEAA